MITNRDKYVHNPVLVKEVIEYLITKKDGIYVDCTTGEGGHSEAILKALGGEGMVISIDRDAEVLQTASKRLESYKNWISSNDNFINICSVINRVNIKQVDGVLLDVGFSSFQMENPERGFSFNNNGPLDMRMSRVNSATTCSGRDCSTTRAWDLVNKLPFEELRRIIREYGEDFNASRIARAIIYRREKKTIDTTLELSGIIERTVRRRGRIHPATRTFQALRIAVNNELENLKEGLEGAIGVLKTGGRICMISFHSLEDRIVKNAFRNSSVLEVITKKPVTASDNEIKINPRARSAKLRVAEKRASLH